MTALDSHQDPKKQKKNNYLYMNIFLKLLFKIHLYVHKFYKA